MLRKARRRHFICLSGRYQRIWSILGKVGGYSASSEALDKRADVIYPFHTAERFMFCYVITILVHRYCQFNTRLNYANKFRSATIINMAKYLLICGFGMYTIMRVVCYNIHVSCN